MRTLVDGDACPVRRLIERIAAEYGMEVWVYMDRAHEAKLTYAQLRQVDTAHDAVDIALMNDTAKGDIVITQDYGLAAMVLGKQAHVLNHNGMIYSAKRMEGLLNSRYLNSKRHGRVGVRGIKKRTKADDARFERAYRMMIERYFVGRAR